MDKRTLRKVQLIQLDIAKEIKRICKKNDIKYFLEAGSLLGAVRHQGFIPWDDDLDIGMLRDDYNRFCEIAPDELKEEYYLQTWTNDLEYHLPFAKVRKKGTVFVESKSAPLTNNGIYVDIFPFDDAPQTIDERDKLIKQLNELYRLILMKCHAKPWSEDGATNVKKRIGYLLYQFRAITMKRENLIERYEELIKNVANSTTIYEQCGLTSTCMLEKEWFQKTVMMKFEDDEFMCPENSVAYLEMLYGDYMCLPPESERENRHQIVELGLGE